MIHVCNSISCSTRRGGRTLILPASYIPKVLYDEDVDVLYLKYTTNRNATAREIGGHIIAYYDDFTGLPTTLTITGYKWLETNKPGWKVALPVPVNFDRDVIPFLQ